VFPAWTQQTIKTDTGTQEDGEHSIFEGHAPDWGERASLGEERIALLADTGTALLVWKGTKNKA
jgi:hypothetical protein